MRLGFRAVLLISVAVAVGAAGCGGGSSGSTETGGGLTMRALWQQPTNGTASDAAHTGGFGSVIPRAVKSVVVRVDPADGVRRCIAVDATSGQRQVVLHKLPAGPATVTIFGAPVDLDFARAACFGLRPGTPSFQSDPHPVTIRPARFNDAGDIEVYSVPFLLNLDPPAQDPPGSVAFPNVIRLTIADAIAGIDRTSLQVSAETVDPRGLSLTPCDDAGGTPCSSGGELGVSGFLVEVEPPLPGPHVVHVVAHNLASPSRKLDFTYAIVVTGSAGTGAVNGTVINCLTGAPLAANVALLKPQPQTTTAGVDGSFAFDQVPFGDFEVQATATGFVPAQVTGTLSADMPVQNVTIAICPPIALRAVLTWGSGPPAPADLDAHLRGPATGTSVAGQPVEFNLSFVNSDITFPTGGHATLDIDTRNFSGPETVSITELAAGRYHYCVHDFSNRSNAQSTALANSSGRVQVFLNNQQVGEFQAPAGNGTVWDVFAIDTTQQPPRIIDVSQLSPGDASERVCHRLDDRDGDGLTDAQEAVLGTDPDVSDTNANGVSDGEDVIEGNSPLPPPTPTPSATNTVTPTPTQTATATALDCPTATPGSSNAGSILVFENLRVDGTNDPIVTITNTSNAMVHAYCFYADAHQRCSISGSVCSIPADCASGESCDPGCRLTDFQVVLTRLSSLQWQPSMGNPSVAPVPEIPFKGELVCVEIDSAGSPLAGNHIVGTLRNTAECPTVTTHLNGFDNGNLDSVLCLGGGMSNQCPTGAEYDSCPTGLDPARITGCWNQSQFMFQCGT